jgi:hypothetical protein
MFSTNWPFKTTLSGDCLHDGESVFMNANGGGYKSRRRITVLAVSYEDKQARKDTVQD